MRPRHRQILLALCAALLVSLAAACGADNRGTPGFGATPTALQATLEPLSADEVLDRASHALENAASFEALYVVTRSGPEGTTVSESIIRLAAPGSYYVRTEDSGEMFEVVAIDRTHYSRRGAQGEVESLRWQQDVGQLGSDYDQVSSFTWMLEEPEVTDTRDGVYVLSGTTQAPTLYGGGGFKASIKYTGGAFTLRIDGTTFAPISASYEMTRVRTLRSDPETREEVEITYSVEFLSFNEPVTVTVPPGESVDVVVAATPTPITVPDTANSPLFVFPILEDPARFTVRPTPTPYPPGVPTPAVQPTALPPTPIEVFRQEIAAAAPSDRFEVAPGIVAVYPPCGTPLDEVGRLFVKLYDLGDPAGPPVESSYMAVISVWASTPTAGIDYPGHVTTVRIAEVVDDSDLWQEIVRRADPAARCG